MTLDRLPDYLDHMLEAVELACSYVAGMPKDDFLEDKRTQQAVVLNLIVIGEAATKILKEHPDFASKHSAVPWTGMKGMRNRIAHGYYDINLDTVWETVDSALPDLQVKLMAIKVALSTNPR
jgi:uncharacterized protein with HEPN domain